MKLARGAHFFAGVWAGMAPMLVWALHFAVSYVAVAVMCASAVRSGAGEPEALRWSLVAATALAVWVLAAMLWHARASAPESTYVQIVQRVGATLSLIGVAWSGVPLAMLPVCGP
jgi:hypothetical protein